MRQKKRNYRLLAILLALILVVSMVPFGSIEASGTGTLMGAPETVKVGQNLTARENNLNKGWKFYLGDNSSASGQNFDDSSWQNVDLPTISALLRALPPPVRLSPASCPAAPAGTARPW